MTPREMCCYIPFLWNSFNTSILFISLDYRINKILTQCPCKIQSLNQIPFFNFIKSICYISWSRCLKFIDVWLAPFDPRVGVQISPKCQKRENNLSLYWNHFNWKSLRLLCCLKSQMKFFLEFPYSWENWEFFANLVFWKF